jgi:hypothetical protein
MGCAMLQGKRIVLESDRSLCTAYAIHKTEVSKTNFGRKVSAASCGNEILCRSNCITLTFGYQRGSEVRSGGIAAIVYRNTLSSPSRT